MLFILKRFQASFVIPKQQRVNSGKLVAPYAKKMHLKTYSNEAGTAYDNYNSTCCLLIHHHYQGPSINDVKQYFPPNFLSLNLHLPKKGPFVYNYFFNKVFFSENIMVLLRGSNFGTKSLSANFFEKLILNFTVHFPNTAFWLVKK